mmetsp:Transcript_11791/g.42166  ORF Transcript_11791/g.42166 Transcript_11791/m.42166 type:complete len:225 (+) Transcript_11791:1543-2217(+)
MLPPRPPPMPRRPTRRNGRRPKARAGEAEKRRAARRRRRGRRRRSGGSWQRARRQWSTCPRCTSTTRTRCPRGASGPLVHGALRRRERDVQEAVLPREMVQESAGRGAWAPPLAAHAPAADAGSGGIPQARTLRQRRRRRSRETAAPGGSGGVLVATSRSRRRADGVGADHEVEGTRCALGAQVRGESAAVSLPNLWRRCVPTLASRRRCYRVRQDSDASEQLL